MKIWIKGLILFALLVCQGSNAGQRHCEGIVMHKVVPMLYVGDYLDFAYLRHLRKTGKKDKGRNIRDKLGHKLYVHYVYIGEYGYSAVRYGALDKMGISETELKASSYKRLRQYFQCQGTRYEKLKDHNIYGVTPYSNSNLNPSIILLDEYWGKARFHFKGKAVVFFFGDQYPRSITVASSKDPRGIDAASVAIRVSAIDRKIVRKKGYIRMNGKWVVFNPGKY